MRKLILSECLSLDGVMQAPGLPDEDRGGGFEYGGWPISPSTGVLISTYAPTDR
jgi:hypothetical protein